MGRTGGEKAEANRRYIAKLTPEQKAAKAAYLKQWRIDNADGKYKEQRENYAEQHRENCNEWYDRNAEVQRARVRERRSSELAYRLAKRYGMSIEEARVIADGKPNQCDICGLEKEARDLHYEHCHETGKHRGWACQNCNHGLGNFKDSPELLRAAADYLERSRAQ